jgi:hypothetical protein
MSPKRDAKSDDQTHRHRELEHVAPAGAADVRLGSCHLIRMDEQHFIDSAAPRHDAAIS